MVVGVGIWGSWFDLAVTVSGDRRSFIYIERMVVYQRDDARRLREHKEAQHAGAQPADRSHERHGIRITPATSYARPPQSVCGKHVTERNYFSPASEDMRRRRPAGLVAHFDLDGRMHDPEAAGAQPACDEAQGPKNW